MKRGIKALVVGIVVFVGLNGLFFVYPVITTSLIKPLISFFSLFLESKIYSKLIGSEYREVVTLSIFISILIGVISYFIIPNKNEK